jgi:hypothetical protein
MCPVIHTFRKNGAETQEVLNSDFVSGTSEDVRAFLLSTVSTD